MSQFQKNFKAIYFDEKQLKFMYQYLLDLSNCTGCYYLGYVYEDLVTNMRIGFSSNPDWQNEYIGNSLIDDCHIWQTVVTQFIQSKKEHLILPWEVSTPSTSLHKDIMLYRQEKHIGNGISICSQDESSREYFALCPMINDKNFLKHAIANMFTVKYNLMKFRKIRINAFDKIVR